MTDEQMEWVDGTCLACGSVVIEKADAIGRKDYMNMCTNNLCENNHWHSCYDDEELEYYSHVR